MLPILTLVLGVVLWAAAHFWKRVDPDSRTRWGDRGKGLVTILLLVSIGLMVAGYRAADVVPLWEPPAFLRHVNNLLMLVAVYFFAASGMKTGVTRVVRHPQLTGVKTWAIAHLLVNGDVASVVLFGGLLAWAVAEVVVLNKAGTPWVKPGAVPVGKEVGAAVGAVVVFGVIGLVHGWIGPWPFGG